MRKSKFGVALTALHYLRKEDMSFETALRIQKTLTKDEFMTLQACRMPSGIKTALDLVTI